MSEDLGEFFSLIGKAKQEKEDEFRSLVGDIDIDSIFKEAKKSVEEDKKKKIKEEKQAKALEAWLYAEPKVEDKKEEVEPEPEEEVVEEAEDTLEIEDLYGNPKFEVIDIIKPEPLGKTKIAEEQTDIVEENDTIGKALNLLGKLKTKEEIQEQTTDPEIIRIRGELEYLKNLVNAQGGGGEVRLEFLDDVDRDTAKVDGKFLKYQSSTGKWVGADASGGGGGSQTLDEVLTEGNTSSLGMNVGVVTATSFDGTATFATSAGIATEAVSAGIATFATSAGIATEAVSAGIATDARGLTGTPNITVGNVIGVAATFTGNVSIGGTLNYEDVSNIDVVGLVTARSGVEFGLAGVGGTITGSGDAEFAGIVTATRVHVGVDTGFFNEDLVVNGDARVTGILTVGSGSITLNPNTKQVTGIDEFIVGSGASISLAPFLSQKGRFEIDYSTINLNGYGSLSGTYNRQSTSFYLISAPSYSGSARFFNGSGYYYFLHETDNSKIIIYNTADGYWSAIHSSGSDFSSPSVYQVVSPVTQSVFIHPYRTTLDGTGRLYPVATSGIEYATTIVGQTSLLGISTATTLNVTGVSTFQDDVFLGDGDRLYFGADSDLAIFHNSNNGNSVISALGDGKLNINATTHNFKNQAGSETKATFHNNGSVELYYDNSKKIETSGVGVTVYGTTQTDEVILPEGLISSGITTTTTTSESAINSFSASTYRSAKYQIQITQGSNYHTTEVNIVHDGSDSYGTEYGTIKTGSSLASFNTDISGGNVRLLATPASSSSTVFKLIRTLIEV